MKVLMKLSSFWGEEILLPMEAFVKLVEIVNSIEIEMFKTEFVSERKENVTFKVPNGLKDKLTFTFAAEEDIAIWRMRTDPKETASS